MSGGFFNYRDDALTEMAESIEHELHSDPHGKVIPIALRPHFEDAVFLLSVARAYARSVDHFLSGDDGQKEFLHRLWTDINIFEMSFGRGHHVRSSVLSSIDRVPSPPTPTTTHHHPPAERLRNG